MRQGKLAVLTMLLCLLCACGGGKGTDALQAPLDFRAGLCAGEGCAFRADGTADWGETVFSFSLDCALSSTGSGTVTVLAPDTVAGIRARVNGAESSLEYEDLALGFSPLPGQLAPLQAPALLVRAWAEGYIAGAGMDADLLCVQYDLGYEPDKFTVYTWFDGSAAPLRSEIYYKNSAVMGLTLTDFTMTAGGTDETTETNLGQRVPGQSEP